MRKDRSDVLKRVISAAGGIGKIATHIGIRQNVVSMWSRVPPKHAVAVAKLTGIPLHELRPDIFPAPQQGQGNA
ncbi:MAG TPA: YdaS family helix-turn-helix protein [Bradyrhizobium sp.]|nr:YdaS family helix-turn-helix protein [Bradyrhizobium sp.]